MSESYVDVRISDAARATGFDPSAIRYYERIGLIPQPQRNESGHRVYGADEVERLKLISSAKSLGLSLEDIRGFLGQWERGECPAARVMLAELVQVKLVDIRRRISDLQEFHDALAGVEQELTSEVSQDLCGPGCGCDVSVTLVVDVSNPLDHIARV